MANFSTHIMGAMLTVGMGVAGMLVIELISLTEAAVLLGLGTIGGILPDMDANKSIPVRIGFSVLAFVVASVGLLFVFDRYEWSILCGAWLALFLAIRYGLCYLFTRCTIHRGLFHSVPAGLFVSLLLVVIAYDVFECTPDTSWRTGCVLFLGFITHLCLDELYSVDLFNVRIKKSFGTALKLGSTTNLWGTVGLYLACGLLAYYGPPYPKSIDKFSSEVQKIVHER